MTAPYYVAMYGGFLVLDEYSTDGGLVQKLYTVADVRLASPFDTYLHADSCAKWAVGKLYPPGRRYFAIMCASFGSGEA